MPFIDLKVGTTNAHYNPVDCLSRVKYNTFDARQRQTPFVFGADCNKNCDLDKALVADLFIIMGQLSAGYIERLQYHVAETVPGLTFDLEMISATALAANANATGTVLQAGLGANRDYGVVVPPAASAVIDMYGAVDCPKAGCNGIDHKYVGIRIKTLPTPLANCAPGKVMDGLQFAVQVDWSPFEVGFHNTPPNFKDFPEINVPHGCNTESC